MKQVSRYFPDEEYARRREAVRERLDERALDAVLIASPENIYYLTGLDHMGYFACQLLLVPRQGDLVLVTRAMERATIRDLVPDVVHLGYSDGTVPDEVSRAHPEADGGRSIGVNPAAMSYGMPARDPRHPAEGVRAPVMEVRRAIGDAGLSAGTIAMEWNSTFLPYAVADGIVRALPEVTWQDAGALVDDCRIVQSPLELACTRRAARLSESMMLAAQAAAGEGVHVKEVMAAIYDVMFRRGGTYPGFIPLVRSTSTLDHEHGTWQDTELSEGDILFLEMSGCVRRYHAPMGRLVFVGARPGHSTAAHDACREAIETAASHIGPGVKAGDVYRAWQAALVRHGISAYQRHHCGYSVGIGFPPSWSGSGVPVGLRPGSELRLRAGMVFHLMSWLLGSSRGDSFLSDTVVVTDDGCELLTDVSRDLCVRA